MFLQDYLGNFHAGVIVTFDPPTVQAVPGLVVALKNTNQVVRRAAAKALGSIVPPAVEAVASLIEILGDPDQEIRAAAVAGLQRIGDAAVPALKKARSSPDPTVGLAAVQILARIAPAILAADAKIQKTKGIERAGDEALKLVGQLEVFYWIGALCRKRRTDSFSFTELEVVLPDLVTKSDSLSTASIRRHVEDVSKFFRAYYKKYEGVDVPKDEDWMAADGDKFVTRYAGARRQMIGAVGWRAWEETRRYLKARGFPLMPISQES